MSHTKQQILDWISDYFTFHDILSIVDELFGYTYRDWLIEKVVEVLKELDTRDIEELFEDNESLTKKAEATIKRAKRGDIVKAIIDGMGFHDEKDMFEDMAHDLEE